MIPDEIKAELDYDISVQTELQPANGNIGIYGAMLTEEDVDNPNFRFQYTEEKENG